MGAHILGAIYGDIIDGQRAKTAAPRNAKCDMRHVENSYNRPLANVHRLHFYHGQYGHFLIPPPRFDIDLVIIHRMIMVSPI